MARRKQKNFNRQMYAVRNLERPGSVYDSEGRYVLTKFQVEEWETGHVCVIREYKHPDWQGSFAYHDCYKVGPRGAVKQIYSNLY